MKKYFLLLVSCALFLAPCAFAQNVGIGTSNPQNKLHVAGGFRLDTLANGTDSGLLKHDKNGVVYRLKFTGNATDVLRGDGTFGTGGAGLAGWSLTGNSGTNPATNFIGTTDDQPLRFKVNNTWAGELSSSFFGNLFLGYQAGEQTIPSLQNGLSFGNRNTAVGYQAMFANTTGTDNAAFGYEALHNNTTGLQNNAFGLSALTSNTSGAANNAFGIQALASNTTGFGNSAFGNNASVLNKTGSNNTAIGNSALELNRVSGNTAVGANSLFRNTFGYSNVAIGINALYNNTTASNLVAVGDSALYNNTNGYGNTAVGSKALYGDPTYGSGTYNTANGFLALNKNHGSYNCAFGWGTLAFNGGNFNVAIGMGASTSNFDGHENVAIGSSSLSVNQSGWADVAVGAGALANTYATGNVGVGYNAGFHNQNGYDLTIVGNGADVLFNTPNLHNSIAIGHGALISADNQIRLGDNNITDFTCRGAANAITAFAPNVYINASGQFMRNTSSARYKEDITDIEVNTSKIYELRPVSFTSIGDKTRHFGLIAEEVAQTIPELAEFAKEKDVIKGSTSEKLIPDAVQYPMLSVLILKEVQKHEKEISSQQKLIEDQNKKIDLLQQQVNDLINEIKALKKN